MNAEKRERKEKRRSSGSPWRRSVSLLLCLSMSMGLLGATGSTAVAASTDGEAEATAKITADVTRQADRTTMDTYQGMLNFSENTRYAGRLWTDKSVLAYGQADAGDRKDDWNSSTNLLQLTADSDGVDDTIQLDADFLHIYSALGSSLTVKEYVPVDMMFVVDISGSMGSKTSATDIGTKEDFEKGDLPINKTIKALNEAIDMLIRESPNSRFGIVVYGTTSAVLLPLGHYEKSGEQDVLAADYIDKYGTNQGLHFTVSATVQTESGEKVYCADNAGQTSDEAHDGNDHGSGNNTNKGTSGHTEGKGTSDEPYHVGHITNPQAGLAQAMDQFITDNSETAWETETGESYLRIPALIHMTDGQASDIAWIQPQANEGGQAWEKTVSNWNAVNWNYDLAYNSTKNGKENEYNAAQLTGAGDTAPVMFQTLMTAAYYKSAVEKYYNQDGVTDVNGKAVDLRCYSIYASDTQPYDKLDNQKKATVDAILNPSDGSNGFNEDDEGHSADSSQLSKDATKESLWIDTAYELYKKWLDGSGVEATFSVNTTSGKDDSITYTLVAKQDQLTSGAYQSRGIDVTREDIEKNIRYVPKDNFYSSGFGNIGGILSGILDQLTGEMFQPVSGTNALHVGDSITFMDPIGKYMEIKEVKDLLLFGSLYPVKKTAVYSYEFNETYKNAHPEDTEGGSLKEGWYKGDDGATATRWNDENLPEGCKDEAAAWAAGWVYRLNATNASVYVPSLSDISGDNPDSRKMQATEYTFYRVDLPEIERNRLHMNPAYGKDEDISATNRYDESGKGGHMEQPGVYALSDLRIWVEDTGDYNDELVGGDGGIESDPNFDQALWVDIPANMLPLRTVSIEQQQNTWAYTYHDDFPLRVFYTVGVEESLLMTDRHINLADISAEYVQDNKVATEVAADARGLEIGDVEFFSNWYNPENRYSGYAGTDTDYTFGDPASTFSPSPSNHYYIFQEPMPLYTAAQQFSGGQWKKVEAGSKENGTELEGTIIGIDLETDFASTDKLSATPQDGDIVLLKEDRLTTEPTTDFESTYYFMPIDFYTLDSGAQDGTATPIQYCVTRRGSDFTPVEGEALCWYDLNSGTVETDLTQKPDAEGDWVLAAKAGGLRSGRLAQAIGAKKESESDKPQEYPDYKKERFPDQASDFVVRYYAGNTTRTANNYYLPTISSTEASGTPAQPAAEEGGNNITVNTYLGNNGRLWTSDTSVLMTKTVEAGPDGEIDTKKEFNYQVFIDGQTGPVDAIVVKYETGVDPETGATAGHWRRQLHYIDLNLSNELFLQTVDGKLARVNENGELAVDGPYYVYIGYNAADTEANTGADKNVMRVYHNTEVHSGEEGYTEVPNEDITPPPENGWEGTYYATKVWLFTQEQYDDFVGSFDINASQNEDGSPKEPDTGSYIPKANFKLLTVQAADQAAGAMGNPTSATDISIDTPYLTDSAYWTETVNFGLGEDISEEQAEELLYDQTEPHDDRPDFVAEPSKAYSLADLAAHTAEVTLTHGYGLLFTGIPNDTNYRVTEKLRGEDIAQGYSLSQVRHSQQYGSWNTYTLGRNEFTGDDLYTGEALKGIYGIEEGKTENFYNSNALLWESYATFKDGEKGNHHQPTASEGADKNPACVEGGADEEVDGVTRHYFVRKGELVDKHYEGEQEGFGNNRYVVGCTAHFDNNNHAYSVFGDTGAIYEEAVHYSNAWSEDKTETQINGKDVLQEGGAYPGVQVGDTITYDIKWHNSTGEPARVTITDPLDVGVDFVEASAPGQYFESADAANAWLAETDLGYTVQENGGNGFVIWDLGLQSPGESGSVQLTVRVNEKAASFWDYDMDGQPDGEGKPDDPPQDEPADKDYEVRDRATVRVAENTYTTNTAVNPVGEPEKTETEIAHGAGQTETTVNPEDMQPKKDENGEPVPDTEVGPLVYVGDRITYEITWRNYESEEALVTIRDPLDEHVRLISASFDPADTRDKDGESLPLDAEPGLLETLAELVTGEENGYHGAKKATLTPETADLTGDKKPGSKDTDLKVNLSTGDVPVNEVPVISYTYDEAVDKASVTWNLGLQPAGSSGKVMLVVEVLPGASVLGYVDNTAYVKVDGDPEQQTDTIENPTPKTEKTEVTPGDGARVKVGDLIEYEIKWDNSHDASDHGADEELYRITVTDPLDPGVDFVRAGYGEYTLEAGEGAVENIEKNFGTWTPDEVKGELDADHGDQKGYYPVTIAYNLSTHTVTWTLRGQTALDALTGQVNLVVRVNSRALVQDEGYTYPGTGDNSLPGSSEDWAYRQNDGLEEQGGQLVQNRAGVKFGNGADIVTDLVKNPVGPVKEEVEPGDGAQVQVGETIHYRIHWQNYRDEAAAVTIEDPLDAGVDFVSASFRDTVLQAGADGATVQTEEQVTIPSGDPRQPDINRFLIQYLSRESAQGGHTVTWNLGVQPALADGYVDLYVRVNEDAARKWQYGSVENDDAATPETEGEKDLEVVNRASVQVGNDSKIYTDIVENPIPEKTETEAGGQTLSQTEDFSPKTDEDGQEMPGTTVGPLVLVGDVLTYEIAWKNAYDEPADITVMDELDPGVDFLEAGFGKGAATSLKLTQDSVKGGTVTLSDEAAGASVAYTERGGRRVTWNLSDRPAGADGIVTLKVRVNENALEAGFVDNQARVTVGNSSRYTGTVENPVPKLEKTETSPGAGAQVMPGDKVDYEISWNNYKEQPATVTVRDVLDPGVNFSSARFMGVILSWSAAEENTDPAEPTDPADGDTPAQEETAPEDPVPEVPAPEGSAPEEEKPGDAVTDPNETETENPGKPDASLPDVENPPADSGTPEESTGTTESVEPAGEADTPEEAGSVMTPGEAEDAPLEGAGDMAATPGTAENENAEPQGGPAETPAGPENTGSEDSLTQDAENAPADGETTGGEEPGTPGDEVLPEEPTEEAAPTEPSHPAEGPVLPIKTYGTVTLADGTQVGVYIAYFLHQITWIIGNVDENGVIIEEEPSLPEEDMPDAPDEQEQVEASEETGEQAEPGEETSPGEPDASGLKGVPAGYEGIVTFSVIVNDRAFADWDYDANGNPVLGGTGKDAQILNQGSVQVGNDRKLLTKIIPNPLEPTKTEEDINGGKVDVEVQEGSHIGPQVSVGDVIRYTITWQNNAVGTDGQGVPADVVIRDVFTDTGLEFVDAGFVSTTNGVDSYPSDVPDGCSVTHEGLTTTWTLSARPAGATGKVWIQARVTANAVERVENRAFVKIGDRDEVQTDPVENPVGQDGGLTVTKTVTGTEGDKTKEFHFTVTLSDMSINGTYGDMIFTDGVASFTLRDGESRTATGLPPGITYTVTETEANQEGYTTTPGTPATGTIPAGSTARADFTNHKGDEQTGSLTVSKTVVGADADVNRDWHFTVTLSDTSINGTYGDMTFTSGVASFTLKHGESKTATGLPQGITYSVTEAEANQDGYTTTPSGDTGIIPETGSAQAQFINDKYTPPPQEYTRTLTVTKTVMGEGGDLQKEWHFTVTLSDTSINGPYGGMTFVNGVAHFTLRHGQSALATGLPPGITYTVTEEEAGQDGYRTEATGDTGTLPEVGAAHAYFTNEKTEEPDKPEEPNEPDVPDEPDIPEKPNPPTTPPTPAPPSGPPKTEDPSRLNIWVTLALLAAMGLVVTTVPLLRKRRAAQGRRTRARIRES